MTSTAPSTTHPAQLPGESLRDCKLRRCALIRKIATLPYMSARPLLREHFLLITGSSVTPYGEPPSDGYLAWLDGNLRKGVKENLF
jgi:hypothetical protein